MKITKTQLKQIIKEEISNMLVEGQAPDFRQAAESMKDASVLNAYYWIAKGNKEMLQFWPDWMSQEFAKKMLIQVASYVTDQEMSGLRAHSVDELVDTIENKLK